jgi:hypothetical protein
VYNFAIFAGYQDDWAMVDMGQTWFVLYWGYGAIPKTMVW